jgi:RNA polymerase sigma factor (sigma-70 family)
MARSLSNGVVRYIHHIAGAAGVRDLTDKQLLERFAANRDEAAFRALLDRYGALVLGVCWRVLRHEQDAEDAFQATFLVLARKAGTVCWRDSVGNWLYEVAHRLAAEARKNAARRRRQEAQAGKPVLCQSPDTAWQELCSVIDDELQRLPDKYRAPVVLCCLQGMKRAEAARHLGWTEGTVKGRLERGRNLLRRRLVRRGLLLSPGLAVTALTQSNAANLPGAPLAQATVRAATWYAASRLASPDLVSAKVAALVEGVTKAMFVSKLKAAVAGLLALVILGAGMGVLAQQNQTGKPANVPGAHGQPETKAQLLADGSLQLTWQTVAELGIRTGQARARSKVQPRVLELSGSTAIDPGRLVRVHARFPGEVIELGTNETTGSPLGFLTSSITRLGDAAGKSGAAAAKVQHQSAAELPKAGYLRVYLSRPLKVGDRVSKGMLLAVVWNRELGEKKGELLDHLIQLHQHLADLQRLEGLRDVVPEATVLQARRSVEAERNQVARAERNLRLLRASDAEIKELKEAAERLGKPGATRDAKKETELARVEIRAPIDGVLVEVNVSQNEVVGTNTTLFAIADLARLQVLANAAESDLPVLESLPPNMRRWTIRVPSDPQATPAAGSIEAISKLDRNKHQAVVTGSVENASGQLRAGQFITARVVLSQSPVELVIPASALVEEGGKAFVFVQQDAAKPVYSPQPVEVVRRGGNVIHVRVTYAGSKVTLYHNNGDGTFTDVTTGLDLSLIRDDLGMGVVVGDFDGDGFPDIHIAGGQTGTVNQSGKIPVTTADGKIRWADVGGPKQRRANGTATAFLDYDNDGNLDLLITTLLAGSPTLQPGSHILIAGAVEVQAIRDDLKPDAKR